MTIERWAFTDDEFRHPESLNRRDTLIATVPGYELGVIVHRDGEVSNWWVDGTAGVPADAAELAADVETLHHPDSNESTARWADVEADSDGKFVRFTHDGR